MQYFKNFPNFKLGFYGINKLTKFIKEYIKTSCLFYIHFNVVYKIRCLYCEVTCKANSSVYLKIKLMNIGVT